MNIHRVCAPRSVYFVYALFLVLAAVPALAQGPAVARPASILDDYQFQEQARKGLDYLYNMDFAAADPPSR